MKGAESRAMQCQAMRYQGYNCDQSFPNSFVLDLRDADLATIVWLCAWLEDKATGQHVPKR